MLDTRKQTRRWLKLAPLSHYTLITTEAKLTPKEKDTLDKIILYDYSQQKIALENHEDISCVKRLLRHTYDKIHLALSSNFKDPFNP
jgi:hypothetical protein